MKNEIVKTCSWVCVGVSALVASGMYVYTSIHPPPIQRYEIDSWRGYNNQFDHMVIILDTITGDLTHLYIEDESGTFWVKTSPRKDGYRTSGEKSPRRWLSKELRWTRDPFQPVMVNEED